MFVIEVIPLAVLPNNVPQLLSYFHDAQIRKGAMVEVIIGRRKVKAIVISCSPLEAQKGALKKSLFQLKKISKVISEESKVSEIQFKILLWLTRHYYTPLGLSLKTVLPSFLLNKKYKVENIEVAEKEIRPDLMIMPAKDTIQKIVSIIRDAEDQVLVILPDKAVLDYFYKELSSKFETVIVHSSQGIKEKFKTWQKVQSGVKLTLGTRQALLFPFKNLSHVIVEDSLNEMYKSDMTPKYNATDMAEKVAQLYGAKITFTTPLTGVSNYYKTQNHIYSLHRNKSPGLPEIKLINTINELRADNFRLLSRELQEEIIKALDKNKKVLIFSPRKGYSGLLLCQNCGSSVKCPNCSVPMRVHKSIELLLVCHRCSFTQQFPQLCLNCNSYKLKTAGPSGSQKIYDEIRGFLSENNHKAPLLVLDTDVVKNDIEAEEIIKDINKPGPAVLIATQMVFSHRYDLKFSLVGIINADALSTTPDFNTEEKFLYQIHKILDFEPNKLILQSYSDDGIYKNIYSTDHTDFYESELETRKLFNYPPFCRLVKLSTRHIDQKKASTAARVLVEKLRMAVAHEKLNDKVNVLDASPAFVEREKGYYVYNVILKVSPELASLKDALKYVPAGWSTELDPKTIL